MEDDLDDLFGDGPSIQLPTLLEKGLLHRVDELASSGCSQKLVWSRVGCIASISPDRHGVLLQHLHCDPRNGQWGPSKQYPLENLRAVHGDVEIVHLSWNHAGTDLATVDAAGRISIHTPVLAMNRLTAIRRATVDPEDTLSEIIGLMWLYTDKDDRSDFFFRPMSKAKTNAWEFVCSPQKMGGPKVARDKPGFISIARNGKGKVVYQSPERWPEVKFDLQNLSDSFDLLTHASICPDKSGDKDALFIATHNSRGQVRIYRLKVNLEKLAASLQVLQTLDDFAPADEASGPDLNRAGKFSSNARLTYLELIPSGPESKNRVPTRPFLLAGFASLVDDVQNGGHQQTILGRWELETSKPTLHPSFETTSNRKMPSQTDLQNGFTLGRLADRHIPKTLLAVQQLNISTVFAMMYSDGSVEFRDRANLETLAPDQQDGQISSLPQIGFSFLGIRNCLHAAMSSSGSAVCTLDGHLSPMINLLQYSKPVEAELMTNEFFETMCEAFVLKFSWANLTGWNYVEDLLSVFQTFSSQMLVDAIPGSGLPVLSDRTAFKAQLLSEVYRVLGIPIDHSLDAQPDQGFKSQFYQRCLSLQACLGYNGEDFSRSPSALLAWTTLSSRYLTMVFLALQSKNPNKPVPGLPDQEIKNPESIHFILGPVSWFITLMTYLFDELFALNNHFASLDALSTLDAAQVDDYMSSHPTPVLPILFASSSRAILRLVCRWINKVSTEYKTFLTPPTVPPPPPASNPKSAAAQQQATQHNLQVQQYQTSVLLTRAYKDLESILARALVDLAKIDGLLGQVDALVKQTYTENVLDSSSALGTTQDKSANRKSLDAEERGRIEKDIVIRGIIPDILVRGVLRPLLSTHIESLKEEVDAAEIYFADISWLGLTLPPFPMDLGDPIVAALNVKARKAARTAGKKRPLVDAMRKVLLKPPRQQKTSQRENGHTATTHAGDTSRLRLRRCARCCALVEDIVPSRTAGFLVAGVQRDCLCGGRWFVLDRSEAEAALSPQHNLEGFEAENDIEMNGIGL